MERLPLLTSIECVGNSQPCATAVRFVSEEEEVVQDEKVGVVGLGGEPEASCASHPKMVEFSSSLFSGGHSSSAVKTKDGSGIELGSWCSNEGMSKLTPW